MKGYTAFPEAPALLEPHHQIVLGHIMTLVEGGVLLLCREAVGVFYSPKRLGSRWGGGSYPSAEIQSMHSTTLTNRAKIMQSMTGRGYLIFT